MNTIKVPKVKEPIPISQIMYIIGDRNYSTVYTNDGKHILTSVTLKCFEDQTADLVRIHKGTLVNPDFIKKIAFEKPGKQCLLAPVVMRDGTVLAVSRRRCEALLAVKAVGVYG